MGTPGFFSHEMILGYLTKSDLYYNDVYGL